MKKIIRLTENDLRSIIKSSVKKILRESDTGNFDDFYPGDASQLRQEKMQQIYQMLAKEGEETYGGFISEMEYRHKVSIKENEVIVGYFDENKYGMSYSEYEDPDGDELDSIIVPLDVAWGAFLKDCYENYKEGITDFNEEIWHFINDALKGKYNNSGIRFEEGSPFGYSDYGE